MRIAIGGIEHESCSFTPVATPLEAFLGAKQFCDAEALARRSGEANTIVDGFIRGLEDTDLEGVPLLWSAAPSGGLASRETFEAIKARLLTALQKALPLDGVLLSLHGSFAVEGLGDADGNILAEVRRSVGPDCVVMAVHDLHSNLSAEMVENADAMIVEKTYPHVDMAERGAEAAKLMARTLRGEVKPTLAYRPLPLFWAAPKMITAEEPMRGAIEQLHRLEREPGVLSASIAVGYQWADVPCAGASVLVVTDDDLPGAQQRADNLARWIWERRATWQAPTLGASEALDRAEAWGRYPIILADQADNTGGGAPGDSTELLRLFLSRGLQDAAVLYVVDPETAAQATAAGQGQRMTAQVGGKSHPLAGPPVTMQVEVCALADGRFTYDGPMWAGVEGDLGKSALLKQDGVTVVVTSQPGQPIDLAFSRRLGLDCRKMRYLGIKSTGHFRSGFEPIAGSIQNVDAAGVLSHDLTKLPFKHLGRKMYPIDEDAEFSY